MATEFQVQQTVARCVTCLGLYLRSGRAQQVESVMIAEIQAAADLVKHLELSAWVIEDDILSPVEYVLLGRHGREAGRRLNTEFLRVFKPRAAGVPSAPA